jgi:hypothetical protein
VGGLSASLSWCYARQPLSTSDKDSSPRIDNRLDGKDSNPHIDSAGNIRSRSKRGDIRSHKDIRMRKACTRRSKDSRRNKDSRRTHSTRRSKDESQQREASRFRGRCRTRPTPNRHHAIPIWLPLYREALPSPPLLRAQSQQQVFGMLHACFVLPPFQVSTRRSLIVGKAAQAEVAWVRPRSPPVGPLEWRNAEGTLDRMPTIQPRR